MNQPQFKSVRHLIYAVFFLIIMTRMEGEMVYFFGAIALIYVDRKSVV